MEGPDPGFEQDLLNRLSAGDRKAFEYFYHRYKAHIYNKLLRLVRSDEIADDLLQEVFYKLWKNRANLQNIRSFSAYLFRMTANLVADFYRKAALDKRLQEQLIYSTAELYDHIEEQINFRESNELIQQAIAALPPQRRLVFSLSKIEGKSYEEISIIMGISRSTINDHMVKAMKSVKSHFLNAGAVTMIMLITTWLNKL